jgi:hypothetical protein
MKLKIFRPVDGVARIVFDDRYGSTGKVVSLEGVGKEDIEARLGPVLEEWARVRKALKDARRQGSV